MQSAPPHPVATAVVIPAGPRDDIEDTLESVVRYVDQPRRIFIVNDTGRSLAHLAAAHGDVHVIPAREGLPPGATGALFVKLADAYRLVTEWSECQVVIRMDADALVTGPGLAQAALGRLHDPDAAVLGAFRIGPDGRERSWQSVQRALSREVGIAGLRDSALRSTLRGLTKEAADHGYVLGEHVLGTCIFSPSVLRALRSRGWLDLQILARSRLSDDHLICLLASAAGFGMADFSRPGDPIAVRWIGLSASPEQLVAQGSLLVHSVRSYEAMSETEIRNRFRILREES